MRDLCSLAWPLSRLGEAIEYLGRRVTRSSQTAAGAPAPPQFLGETDERTFASWLEAIARPWALEVEAVQMSYAEVPQCIRHAGPALFRLPADVCAGEPRFLLVLKEVWGRTVLLGSDWVRYRVRAAVVRDALCAEIEGRHIDPIDQFLARAPVAAPRRVRARRAILEEQLGPMSLDGCWFVRLSPSASLWSQACQARLPRGVCILVGGYMGQLGLTLVAWWLMSRSALTGHFAWGWLLGWALLLCTAIACQGLATVAQSQVSVSIGGLFKQRLLYGVTRLEPEEVRHQGAGQFLSRVMESEAVELLALGGGFVAVLALLQLGVAAAILTLGAAGWLHVLLLGLWVGVTLVLGWGYWRRSHAWIDSYRGMTNTLVEQMVGHRTRLAQEDRASWHDAEDHALGHYLFLSVQMDRLGVQLQALIPRGWAVLGLVGLCYVVMVAPQSTVQIAVSLGGMLLALQALTSLVHSVQSLAGATLAWQQVGPLFQAARRAWEASCLHPVILPERSKAAEAGRPVVTARELRFRYHPQGREVLRECNLQIWSGDRVLLEGPSGGGKSTLAALLAGLRIPETGILLLWGYDRHTMGAAAWRHRVVMVPQFHENHVLSATFAFNLLMGRRWPPRPEDLTEADMVCRELGLGDLLDRMPSGMQQMVGENGWQLSHGECSRLYIARALLQQADMIILDEGFGALDPENLERALRCVRQRAATLLVIAHP